MSRSVSKLNTCNDLNFSLQMRMLLSCKISHSVLSFLDREGVSFDYLYDQNEWPLEFVRDPAYWLEAESMEQFLQYIVKNQEVFSAERMMREAGRACKELRTWGVLDSVLRMVQNPKDLFAQPDRLLSYFISPAPLLSVVERQPEHLVFDWGWELGILPNCETYLHAMLESLPIIIGRSPAEVRWQGNRVRIGWSEKQSELLSEDQSERQIKPELVREVMANLEVNQQEFEKTKRILSEQERELADLRAKLRDRTAHDRTSSSDRMTSRERNGRERQISMLDDFKEAISAIPASVPASQLDFWLESLFRMRDYTARSQQLVTLLAGQGKHSKQVQEAMHRMDWQYVQSEAPAMVQRLILQMQQLKSQQVKTSQGENLVKNRSDLRP